MKQETQSVPDGTPPVDSVPMCAWIYDDEDSHSERCATGKPALFYSCNETGPVCEEHVCRCRPSLLATRADKARRELVTRALQGARQLREQGLISAQTFALLLRDLGEPNQKQEG